MGDFATAGGHWYLPNGEPFYTIVGRNGNERPVTLRDARPVNAVPSVTGIIRMAAAPQLEKWKRDQVLLAALTLPRREGEAEPDWLRRVEQDWQEQGRAAAEKGTRIHGAVEKLYRGEPPDEDLWDWAKLAREIIAGACGEQQWSAERSFASPLGYGGKTDLYSAEWVIDVKTKDGEPQAKLYDEHLMQLAAYRRGLGIPRAKCAILFLRRDVPGAAWAEASEDELAKALAMFDALLAFWQAKNGYRPCLQ
jgi:hypothetical protein